MAPSTTNVALCWRDGTAVELVRVVQRTPQGRLWPPPPQTSLFVWRDGQQLLSCYCSRKVGAKCLPVVITDSIFVRPIKTQRGSAQLVRYFALHVARGSRATKTKMQKASSKQGAMQNSRPFKLNRSCRSAWRDAATARSWFLWRENDEISPTPLLSTTHIHTSLRQMQHITSDSDTGTRKVRIFRFSCFSLNSAIRSKRVRLLASLQAAHTRHKHNTALWRWQNPLLGAHTV